MGRHHGISLNSFLDASTVSAGWSLDSAYGVNDSGWIVGNASNSLLGISSRSFLLAPVPEPESYAMLLTGLGLIGLCHVIVKQTKNLYKHV